MDCYVCNLVLDEPFPDKSVVFLDPTCPHCTANTGPEGLPNGRMGLDDVHVAHPDCFGIWAAARGLPV